jgi:hypothetical protein
VRPITRSLTGRGGEATIRPKPSNNESHNRKLGARTARQWRICQHSGRARLDGSAQNERLLVNVVRQGMPNMLRGFFCCGQGTRSWSEGMDAVDWPTIESVRRLQVLIARVTKKSAAVAPGDVSSDKADYDSASCWCGIKRAPGHVYSGGTTPSGTGALSRACGWSTLALGRRRPGQS